MKKCQKCQNLLPSDAFGARASERDGLNRICKGCIKSAKMAVRERDAPKSQCNMCLQFKFITHFPLRKGRRREVCKGCTGVSRPSALSVAQEASEVRKYVAAARFSTTCGQCGRIGIDFYHPARDRGGKILAAGFTTVNEIDGRIEDMVPLCSICKPLIEKCKIQTNLFD